MGFGWCRGTKICRRANESLALRERRWLACCQLPSFDLKKILVAKGPAWIGYDGAKAWGRSWIMFM